MSGKPLWLEGMFLRPQHLQQHDRWIESNLEQRVSGFVPFSWGLGLLQIDQEALKSGQLKIAAIDAVFPDGTVYFAPATQPLPRARHIPASSQGRRIFLALPLRSSGTIEVSDDDGAPQRFRKMPIQVFDNARQGRPTVDIAIGALNARLVIEDEPVDEMTLLPIAEIESVDALGQVTLSASFIPPLLKFGASLRLVALLEQARGLLKTRAGALAAGAAGRGGDMRSGILDIVLLGVVNRYEAGLGHLLAHGLVAPESLYRDCIALVAELSAYAAASRRPQDLPPYNHLDLRATFETLVAALRAMLSVIAESNAVSIPLSERDFGIWLGEIEDRLLFNGRRFVLIARANVALELIRQQLPIQIKIGPVEQIRDLVNLQLPGITLEPLSVAPREIPFIQNAVYFELGARNPLWSGFKDSAAFALHVSGEYPGLDLELWAIQKEAGQ